jgi:hypothetical protein
MVLRTHALGLARRRKAFSPNYHRDGLSVLAARSRRLEPVPALGEAAGKGPAVLAGPQFPHPLGALRAEGVSQHRVRTDPARAALSGVVRVREVGREGCRAGLEAGQFRARDADSARS